MDEVAFAPGQRVFVPWGLDVVEGTVLESRGLGATRRIVVEIVPPEEDEAEPLVMTFRPDDLAMAAAEADERQPGSWLSEVRYEESLKDAIKLLLARWAQNARYMEPLRVVEEHGLADLIVQAADRLLLVEAKAPVTGEVRDKVLDQLWSHAVSAHLPALLVTNADLSQSAQRRLEELLQAGAPIQVVHWSSRADNDALSAAIEEVLAAS